MRILAGILALTILTGCSSSSDDEQTANPVALVSIARVSSGSVPQTITVFGAAVPGASGTRTVSVPVESVLVGIEAPVGTRVAAGEVIARLRPSSASQLELTRAATEARSSTQAYARAVRLRADGLSSDADVETARANAASANATLASLRARTGGSVLVSTIAGTVTEVSASPGAVLAAGAPVATVTSLQAIRARFGVDPGLARQIPRGAFIRVAPSNGGQAFSVPILSVELAVDPQTRLASVYASLPAQAQLGSGEPLRGEIVIPQAVNGSIIPYSALLNDGGQRFVFVVTKGVVHRRNVSVGTTTPNSAQIRAGVTPGELVVTEGGTALQDGMRVRIK